MTTSSFTPATQTSQRFGRSAPVTALRSSDRQSMTTAVRASTGGTARRFLNVLLRSLSAWAV